MPVTRRRPGSLAVALFAVALGSACAHRRSPDADFEEDRERSVTLASDVTVRATLWDRELVERAATAAGMPKSSPALAGRLHARYADGVVFTVLLELGHRLPQGDPLADPASWWFALATNGRTIPARDVDVLAIDRFPTGGDRVHLRIALRVGFAVTHEDEPVELRIGTRAHERRTSGRGSRTTAQTSRRLALGPLVASRGAALRWTPARPR